MFNSRLNNLRSMNIYIDVSFSVYLYICLLCKNVRCFDTYLWRFELCLMYKSNYEDRCQSTEVFTFVLIVDITLFRLPSVITEDIAVECIIQMVSVYDFIYRMFCSKCVYVWWLCFYSTCNLGRAEYVKISYDTIMRCA